VAGCLPVCPLGRAPPSWADRVSGPSGGVTGAPRVRERPPSQAGVLLRRLPACPPGGPASHRRVGGVSWGVVVPRSLVVWLPRGRLPSRQAWSPCSAVLLPRRARRCGASRWSRAFAPAPPAAALLVGWGDASSSGGAFPVRPGGRGPVAELSAAPGRPWSLGECFTGSPVGVAPVSRSPAWFRCPRAGAVGAVQAWGRPRVPGVLAPAGHFPSPLSRSACRLREGRPGGLRAVRPRGAPPLPVGSLCGGRAQGAGGLFPCPVGWTTDTEGAQGV
jgi:hypothetical protein